jgi:hypothetical protein
VLVSARGRRVLFVPVCLDPPAVAVAGSLLLV